MRLCLKIMVTRVVSVILIISTILVGMSTCARPGTTYTGIRPSMKSRYITRQNFGYVLKAVGNVQLTSGRVRLIFHYPFPQIAYRSTFERVNCTQYPRNSRLMRQCMQFKGVTNNLYEMKRDIVELLVRRMREVNELLEQLPRRPLRRSRGILSWFGGGIADVFGLATDEDMEKLQDLLQNVLDGTQKAVEAWSEGQNLFTRATALTNERFQNVERIINMSQMSILEENSRLEELRAEFHGNFKVIATIIREVHLAIRHCQETEAFYLGIQQLTQGHLSHHIVPREVLQEALDDMSSYIYKVRPDMTLLHSHVRYYYQHAEMGASIHYHSEGYVLFVTVYAPTTLRTISAPLEIWEITKFPLQAPDGQEYYTLLNVPFHYILCHYANPYYLVISDTQNLPQTKFLDIHEIRDTLYSTEIPSCAMAMMAEDLEDIKNLCGYHLIFAPLPSSVYRIGYDKLLMTNISTFSVKREERINVSSIDRSVHINKSHAIYNMPCESRVYVLNQIFYSKGHCNSFFDDELHYNLSFPLNLPVLREYFNHSLLDDINAAMELNDTIKAKLPPLTVEKPEFFDLLAKENDYVFDFEKVINTSNENKNLYNSLSHLIWTKMVENAAHYSDFNPFSYLHWMTLISLILSVLNAFMLLFFFMRLKSLSILVASFPRISGQFIYTSTTSVSSVDSLSFHEIWLLIQRNVSELWSIEFILILIFILFVGFSILFIKREYFAVPSFETVMRLDLRSSNGSYTCVVQKLAYPANYYRFDIRHINLQLISQSFFTCLSWGRGLVITDTLREETIKIHQMVTLKPWEVRKVRRILSKPHYTALLVLYDQKDTVIDVLNLYSSKTVESSTDVAKSSLYPTLT